ncbi:hypothetical protein RDI86_02110 [Cellulosimicrobium sp. XJ-DQ-B-000]|uniref:hypothetical protein n=1 Tax=Cellulosimicrobium sp. XJ-DQ-B-000 TaxID=3072182 RepID=UPI002808C0AC|nr:hypothetical protein [Cellulosimicrobium sp. XJ-DQ-B-000]MDQ8040642.1 hypothetical protein [Cellulosimicrobium sp. XJ-DQ-B-000]
MKVTNLPVRLRIEALLPEQQPGTGAHVGDMTIDLPLRLDSPPPIHRPGERFAFGMVVARPDDTVLFERLGAELVRAGREMLAIAQEDRAAQQAAETPEDQP